MAERLPIHSKAQISQSMNVNHLDTNAFYSNEKPVVAIETSSVPVYFYIFIKSVY